MQYLCTIAVAATVLAGCGGSSKSDFTAQANAICAHTIRSLRAVPATTGAPGSGADAALAAFLAQAAPIVSSEARQLNGLGRPDGSGAQRKLLARYLAAVNKTAAAYTALGRAARAGDARGIAAAQASLRSSPAAALAAAYGLHDCASPGATVA
jgi:hypothetical protein